MAKQSDDGDYRVYKLLVSDYSLREDLALGLKLVFFGPQSASSDIG